MSNDRKPPVLPSLPCLPAMPPGPPILPARPPTPAALPTPRPAPARAEPARASTAKSKSARSAATTHGLLAPEIVTQIVRLRGTLAPGGDDARSVNTVKGPLPLPPVIDAFVRVSWPTDCAHTLDEEFVSFGGSEITGPLATNYDGPLFAIASTDTQHFFVVRTGDTTSDPRVHRLDHDGSDELDLVRGQPLSKFLAKITAPAAAGVRAKKRSNGKDLLDALAKNDFRAAKALVATDPSAATQAVDRSGFTPLHYAAARGNFADVLRAMTAGGADPNVAMHREMKVPKSLSETLDARTIPAGTTALRLACESRAAIAEMMDTTKALLAAGADPNRADANGNVPLLTVARSLNKKMVSLAQTLLAAKADPNAENAAGDTPLIVALLDDDMSRALLSAGAEPNRVTRREYVGRRSVKGITAMHLAAAQGSADLLDAMVVAGGDVNVPARDGTLPLEIAAGDAIAFLRANGAIESDQTR